MSGLRVLVVEDEAPAREYLHELLVATGQIDAVHLVGAADAATAALAEQPRFDAVFVDIRLIDRPDDVSGLAWVQRVAGLPDSPQIVLATALAGHALAAFDVGAVDYLLKPLRRERVAECVDRLVRNRARTAPLRAKLVARTATSLVLLPIEGALAFEACERLSYVHHVNGRYLVDLSLAALEARLADRVMRVHRAWLVVLDHVGALHGSARELTLQVGATLRVPVSRERVAAVRSALTSSALGRR